MNRGVRTSAFVAVSLLSIVALAGLAGNIALSRSAAAAEAGDWRGSAAHARTAARLAPWSAEPWRLLGESQLGRRNRPAAAASFERAIAKDRGNWLVWHDLAAATDGSRAVAARAEARRLNPLNPELHVDGAR